MRFALDFGVGIGRRDLFQSGDDARVGGAFAQSVDRLAADARRRVVQGKADQRLGQVGPERGGLAALAGE